MSVERCYDIEDLRRLAQRRLPKGLFNYLDQGTGNNIAKRSNRDDFDKIRFLPRTLVDVAVRSTETEIFGQRIAMPFILAPAGPAGIFWYEGELALARAAKAKGIPHILSTYSTKSTEDMAKTGVTLWQQLYFWKDKTLADRIVANAEALDMPVLIVTVDTATLGMREYEKRDGFLPPYGPGFSAYLDMLGHPRWLEGVAIRSLATGSIPEVAN